MIDHGWMLHDGTRTAVIRPFRTREEAERWRSEFSLTGFVAAPIDEGGRSDAPDRAPVPACGGRVRRPRSPSPRRGA